MTVRNLTSGGFRPEEPIDTIYRASNLSMDQLMFWVGQKVHPDIPIYNRARLISLDQHLDAGCFSIALQKLLNTCDALRMTIIESNGTPKYQISPPGRYEVEYIDLSGSAQPESAAREWAHVRGRRIFDMQSGLFDTALLKLSEKKYFWFLNLHHIITDYSSIALLLGRLSDLYEQALSGSVNMGLEIPAFSDQIARARAYHSSARFHRCETYWQEKLAGAAPCPVFFGRQPGRLDTRSERVVTELDPLCSARLKKLAQHKAIKCGGRDASLFSIFSALLATYLHRIGGDRTIALGTPVHNRRTHVEKQTIGLLMQTLPLRVRFEPGDSFLTLIRRIQSDLFSALMHSPFISPQIGLAYEVVVNYHAATLAFLGRPVHSELLDFGHAPKSMLLHIHNDDQTGCFNLQLDLLTSVFTDDQRQCIPRHLHRLLDRLLDNPEQPIHSAAILSPREHQKIIYDWNNPVAEVPFEQCLHHGFELQVRKTPEHAAVLAGTDRLSYAQLNSRANQLARYLQAEGIGPEKTVGLLLDRSIEMLIALLAVLKAGGAYVPLNRELPGERLAYICEDAGMSLILTQSHLRSLLPAGAGRTICLDEWRPDGEAATDPDSPVTPANLAYLIYTSGSTGRPKGVLIEHRQINNYVHGVYQACELAPQMSYAMLQPLSVDSSQTVLFPALTSGGTIHLIPEPLSTDARALHAYFSDNPVDLLKIAPSHLRALMDSVPEPQELLPRSRLIIGGEACRSDWAHELAGRVNGRLFNHYGPTETTVGVLTFEVHPGHPGRDSPCLPLGRPLPNTTAYILDEHMRPVPVGAPGELYLGGAGVARGYLGHNGWTAENFVPDPFSGRAGVRLYKTGDRARHLSTGDIEFLGRLDRQFKLHGHRVEPGEIESALNSCDEVRNCLVTLRTDAGGMTCLLAYVQPAWPAHSQVHTGAQTHAGLDEQVFARKIREKLLCRLPKHMIPAVIVIVDQFPLTAHGKVDMAALPAPDLADEDLRRSYAPPRNNLEKRLAALWQECLNIEKIGIDEDFFELGGHSLLAIQLLTKIQTLFAVDLPPRALFVAPTIARLAELLAPGSGSPRPGLKMRNKPLQRGKTSGEAPLTFSQQRMWFLYQMQRSAVYNTMTAVRIKGILNVTALQASINNILERHEILRTNFVVVRGRPIQSIRPQLVIAITHHDLSRLSGPTQQQHLEQMVRQEMLRTFDLAHDPLIRATLYRLADQEHLLQFTVHHIVYDARSKEILLRELAAYYEAHTSDRPVALPDLPIQFPDFAVWQQTALNQESLHKDLEYWRRQLAGAPPALELPLDRPRPPVQTFPGALHRFTVNRAVFTKLNELGRREGATLFMTLLAALKILLYRYTGQSDLVVGTDIANRSEPECENLIGLFLNTLVLRTKIPEEATTRDVLQGVRETSLGAFAHHELPFEQLVDHLQTERDLSRNSLYQVSFVLKYASGTAMEFGGLSAEMETFDGGTSNFDLTLAMTVHGEELVGHWRYNTDLFDTDTIKRLSTHFNILLAGIVADPGQPITTLPLLPRKELRQILERWNDCKVAYPQDQCIHRLFETQAEKTPQTTAITAQDGRISYQELNRRANQLTHYLINEHGIGPDLLVGLYMERSTELIVGLMAVLKTGAGYLAMDTAQPAERAGFILRDSCARLLLTGGQPRERLPAYDGPIVDVITAWPQIATHSTRNPNGRGRSQDIAYAMYTSGSTGRPKGVLIEHRNVLNLDAALNKAVFANCSKTPFRATVNAPLSADASVQQLLLLLHGHTLFLVPQTVRLDPNEFVAYQRRHAIQVLDCTPSQLKLWLQAGLCAEPSRAPAVVLVGGEAIDGPLWNALRAQRTTRFYNVYGPTECTVDVTICAIADRDRRPTIGRPLANSRAYILDQHLQPLPVGVPGELYIGGAQVGRGYLKRPELDAERFLTDPFTDVANDRMYRTGDRASFLPDGSIVFLGRNDDQVKIRGYRVELGEIESILGGHPRVRECAVVTRSAINSGEPRLTAYVAADDLLTEDLRAHASSFLPGYMVPTEYVFLPRLPRNANRKIDRNALPDPRDYAAEPGKDQEEPQNESEQKLAAIWKEVLDMETIDRHANFFELGGHSLLATQVNFRISEVFNVTLPLTTLFESATVYELAKRIDDAGRRQPSQ